ncbi:hypothetical protein CR513_26819 [Mucuna pruriens]|uniref:Uncharacterized protein n=1 Tax=Mucuna pruriens TaxID=157652 RepID=A0A371GL00_MUCPR|nr:hypothetical protein CR513_26819 [Mucuna pruriens]
MLLMILLPSKLTTLMTNGFCRVLSNLCSQIQIVLCRNELLLPHSHSSPQ